MHFIQNKESLLFRDLQIAISDLLDHILWVGAVDGAADGASGSENLLDGA